MSQRLSRPNIVKVVSSAARSTTGNSGNLRNTAQSVNLGSTMSLILDTTAASGTSPTLDVALQHSPDGGTTWYVKERFTQVTGTGTRQLDFRPWLGVGEAAAENSIGGTTGQLKLNGPICEDHRILWTIGGTNPSFTFVVYAIVQPMENSF